jgi:hypothetical protein
VSARQLARSGSPLRGLLGFPGELFGTGAVLLSEPGVPIGHPRLLGGLGAFEPMLRGEVPSLRGVEFGLLAMATGLFGEPFALQLAACARSARDDRDQSKQDERRYYDDDRLPTWWKFASVPLVARIFGVAPFFDHDVTPQRLDHIPCWINPSTNPAPAIIRISPTVSMLTWATCRLVAK